MQLMVYTLPLLIPSPYLSAGLNTTLGRAQAHGSDFFPCNDLDTVTCSLCQSYCGAQLLGEGEKWVTREIAGEREGT